MSTKVQIRREIALKRKALDAGRVSQASSRIMDNLQRLDEFGRANTVALYKAIAGEVYPEPLFDICRDMGKRTCIPVFMAQEGIYAFAEITSETLFKTGNYGIPEPITAAPMDRDSIDLMIVPGVAFDSTGNRLGRGGGYYDRLLAGFAGQKAAVAFDFQVYPRIPFDKHDISMDLIITETKVMKV